MNTKPSNPPAFPHTMCVPNKLSSAMSGTDIPYDGMSLRDWFAGMALQGLYSNSNDVFITVVGKDALKRGESTTEQTFSRIAYEAADSMLTQREKD